MTPYLQDILSVSQSNLPWEELSGMNILVTGASGLIGSCLVDLLMNAPQRDFQVYAAGRDRQRLSFRFRKYSEDSSFHLLIHDVADPLNADLLFDYVIHAAGYGAPFYFSNNPVEVMKAPLFGVAHLLEYGMNHHLKRFLFVSSGEVYGTGPDRKKRENDYGIVDPLNIRSCYPSAKLAAETLAICYSVEFGVDVVIARPCHVFGPFFSERDDRVYAQFLRNALNGEDLELKSSGLQLRSWCYVVDCASALIQILLKGESGQAYNVADNQANCSIKELADMISEISGLRTKTPSVSADNPNLASPLQATFDTTRLESLGWRPLPGSLREKLMHTLYSLREN